jgi:putative transposase
MHAFQRKRNRLTAESYRGRKAYFLTLCTRERKKVFHDTALVNAVLEVLRKVCSDHYFNVYAYCFMPDHLHLILASESDSAEVSPVVQAFKSLAAAAAGKMRVFDLWQKGYYDHVLRSGESLDAAAGYIFLNPVRAGSVRRGEEWPFSGSFVFEWKRVLPIGKSFDPPWKSETLRMER